MHAKADSYITAASTPESVPFGAGWHNWSRPEAEAARAIWLDPGHPGHASWQARRTAALATGAFPGALLPRMLQRSSLDYDRRRWPIPQTSAEMCTVLQEIPPSWPAELAASTGFDYGYLCVDGGAMDNEPLELVRRMLAGHSREDARNPREASEVRRSVLMIDPFPGGAPMSREEAEKLSSYDVLQTLRRLVTGLKMQARFKLDELVLAQTDNVYSRFMIAPVRHVRRNGQEVQAAHPIASGVMGGFGGFLSERFRQHDFQLGQRNCQQFLRRHFVLPLEEAKKNPIFGGAGPDAVEQHKVTLEVEEDGARKEKDVYPIIPLLGNAREEAFPLQWHTLSMRSDDLERLRRQVTRRTQAVTSRLIDTHLEGSIERALAKLALRIKRGSIVDSIMDKVESDLEGYDLLA